MKRSRLALILCSVFIFTSAVRADHLVFEGESGIGHGKHIVFLAGDHEYRSEETLPALARILAKHYGFKTTVLFNVDPVTGEIVPGNNNMPGTEALENADLMVMMLRFQDFSPEQMQPIEDYLHRAGPVVGLRTSTHAFNIPKGKQYSRYSYDYDGADYPKGFGRRVLGETWAGHYGDNHRMSTRLDLVPEQKTHPILKGVVTPWVQAGGYWTEPEADSTILALAQPLEGMTQDSAPAEGKHPCPGAWTRTYEGVDGKQGRVFTSTYGASVDILNDDYRRMLVNACLWGLGLEDEIKPESEIAFVGAYHPVKFSFDGYRRGVKPLDMAGWDTPIMNPVHPTK
ncbi:ThuA domain-containing protein [Planctomicrobium sp. SH668]|uniref:ThuA domain-containing protein n=1 Tax=Planctomicrobium sp. SH668 TaxID=3448126 RepID=UPI003F5BD852